MCSVVSWGRLYLLDVLEDDDVLMRRDNAVPERPRELQHPVLHLGHKLTLTPHQTVYRLRTLAKVTTRAVPLQHHKAMSLYIGCMMYIYIKNQWNLHNLGTILRRTVLPLVTRPPGVYYRYCCVWASRVACPTCRPTHPPPLSWPRCCGCWPCPGGAPPGPAGAAPRGRLTSGGWRTSHTRWRSPLGSPLTPSGTCRRRCSTPGPSEFCLQEAPPRIGPGAGIAAGGPVTHPGAGIAGGGPATRPRPDLVAGQRGKARWRRENQRRPGKVGGWRGPLGTVSTWKHAERTLAGIHVRTANDAQRIEVCIMICKMGPYSSHLADIP